MFTSLILLVAQLLILAAVRNSEEQTELRAPHLDLAQEVMHFPGIQIRSVPRFPRCGFLASDEIGVGDFHAAEIGFLEVALHPLGSSFSAARTNQIFTDFSVPHMA